MAVDLMIENDQIVCDLRDSLRDTTSGLMYGPKLLAKVLRTDAWKERYDRLTRTTVPFATFDEFVTKPPTEGLGAEVPTIYLLVADDVELRDLLDKARKRPGGVHYAPADPAAVSNIHGSVPRRPAGTTDAAALRRLRKDAKALHTEVLAGELTAHAAMVKAGYRHPTFTVRADSADAAVATLLKRYSRDQLLDALGETHV